MTGLELMIHEPFKTDLNEYGHDRCVLHLGVTLE